MYGTRRVAHVSTNPVISLFGKSHWGEGDGIVVAILGTYPARYLVVGYSITVYQLVMASVELARGDFSFTTRTLGFMVNVLVSLLSATLYEGNHDRKYKPWNFVSSWRCILIMQGLLECCYIEMESSQL